MRSGLRSGRIIGGALGLAALAAGALAAPAGAASGVPDPDFGNGGVAQIAYPNDAAQGQVVVPTGDGIVVVGETATTTSRQGRIVVAGFGANGVVDGSFGSLIGWGDAAPVVGGAVREAGDRLVIATTGTPGDTFPFRIRLTGTGARGGLDPVFGAGGHRTLSTEGRVVALTQNIAGTLLVVGERSGSPNRVFLARVSADGTELGSRSIALGDEEAVGAAQLMPDGSMLVFGTDPDLFVARFRADGEPDTAFGTNGVLHTGIDDVQVDDATLDNQGRIVIAGAHVGDLGRSVGVAVKPLLLRMSASGELDDTFADVGRSAGYVDELTSVQVAPSGTIYASSTDGRVLRFTPSGRSGLHFGVGGVSVAPRIKVFDTAGLVLSGADALYTGDALPPSGFNNRLALGEVQLTGAGTVVPRARIRVRVRRVAGRVTVRTPVSPADQALRGTIGLPLLTKKINGGDGFFYTPPGGVVGAAGGTAFVSGRGGAAKVRHARFTLRRAVARGKIAELDLARPRCGATRRSRVRLRAGFVVKTGRLVIRNRSHRALVAITRRCGRPTNVTVLQGSASVRRTPPSNG